MGDKCHCTHPKVECRGKCVEVCDSGFHRRLVFDASSSLRIVVPPLLAVATKQKLMSNLRCTRSSVTNKLEVLAILTTPSAESELIEMATTAATS
jgi:hypothetical protein